MDKINGDVEHYTNGVEWLTTTNIVMNTTGTIQLLRATKMSTTNTSEWKITIL